MVKDEGERSQKGHASAFSGWHSAKALHEEADRIRSLPPSASIAIMQWRRNRLWQIDQRLREIFKSRTR